MAREADVEGGEEMGGGEAKWHLGHRWVGGGGGGRDGQCGFVSNGLEIIFFFSK